MGICIDKAAGESHRIHELCHFFVYLMLIFADAVYFDGIGNDLTDRHPRIKACIRVLKNDLHLMMHFPHLFLIVFTDIFAAVQDLPAGRLNETQDRSPQRGFSTTGFTHDAQRFSFFNRQINIVNRMEASLWRFKVFF